jgi:phosphomevalonate decarboxylase
VTTNIPEHFRDTVDAMRADHHKILALLADYGYAIEDYPDLRGQGRRDGAAAARAYPIQGVLKYHGMADWQWRTTFLPSISVNNDAGYSLTLVDFSAARSADDVTINGVPAQGRDLERVQQSLDVVRALAGISSGARVVSRNIVRSSKTGKGLGTSASASAALAAAALAAAFGADAIRNTRLLSAISRLLAGSGCRSAVGGISLWLSYPGIAHEDSFAVRLDDRDQLADLRLITVPIDSRINLKTEMAHADAPNSPFFKCWMRNRFEEIRECVAAIQQGDWRTVGQLAELDSIQLHGVTMSGSRENKLFAWEPENIQLFRLCNDLRADGVPVYFSTDTGPTMVFFTHRDFEDQVVAGIESSLPGVEVIRGGLGGPAALVEVAAAQTQLGVE